MRKLLFIGLMVFALFGFLAEPSRAVIIDFSNLENPGEYHTLMESYSIGGFSLTSSSPNSISFISPQQDHAWYYGSASLAQNWIDEWIFLTSANGAFTINSIDLHSLYGGSQGVSFFAYDAQNAQVGMVSFNIPNEDQWYTLNFDSNFENIDKLAWQQVGPSYHLFDNIVLNGAPVPEPTTMLLFGIGLTGMALKRRSA